MAPGPRGAGLSGPGPEGDGSQQNRRRLPFFWEISQAVSGPLGLGPAVIGCAARMGRPPGPWLPPPKKPPQKSTGCPKCSQNGPPSPKKPWLPFFWKISQPACPVVGRRGAFLRFLVSRTRNFGQFFALNFFSPKFQKTWVGRRGPLFWSSLKPQHFFNIRSSRVQCAFIFRVAWIFRPCVPVSVRERSLSRVRVSL